MLYILWFLIGKIVSNAGLYVVYKLQVFPQLVFLIAFSVLILLLYFNFTAQHNIYCLEISTRTDPNFFVNHIKRENLNYCCQLCENNRSQMKYIICTCTLNNLFFAGICKSNYSCYQNVHAKHITNVQFTVNAEYLNNTNCMQL